MPQLNTAKTAVVSQRTKDHLKNATDILGEVQNAIRELGLEPMPKPKNMPQPLGDIDITSVDNRELETLFTQYTGYSQYISPKVAEAEAAYRISTANMKRIEATIMTELKSKEPPPPRDALRGLVREHPLFYEQEIEHLKLYATKVILESYYKSYVRMAQAVSRVIELRKLEFEQNHREQGIGHHKAGATRRPGVPGNFSRPR